ncbi:MAG: hypothetical protein OFPII_00050 [Osedax symbiont Rs1]|nr:MAG: hypothetical protein OFPII_00050 [Osedax symbiont Rs1]
MKPLIAHSINDPLNVFNPSQSVLAFLSPLKVMNLLLFLYLRVI